MNNTITNLKKKGVLVIGLEGSAKKSLYDMDYSSPVCFVVGSEGSGLSPLVRRNCDELVKIPMRGKITSLNASVSASLALFEKVRQEMK